MGKLPINELVEQCEAELTRVWGSSVSDIDWNSKLPVEVQQAVDRSINSPIKTYRYVLPTQVLAKVVDSTLDARSIQEGNKTSGSFDARSLCHKVVVPFDRANHDVLGGAPEPYVNNPLRIQSITAEHRAAQKNKAGFDDLCSVLEFVEADPKSAKPLLHCIIAALRKRLESVQVVYPVPNRASLKQTIELLDRLLSKRTGGVRLQAVSVALFRSIGERFGLYSQVETARINAADASTGSAADLTCLDENSQVVLAVEVKDRVLRLRHVQDKLPAVREKGVRELLFVTTAEIENAETESLEKLIDHEFVTGQNVYTVSFERFLESCLVLFGETGRREFLVHIGKAFDDMGADLTHRQTWRDLLGQL